MDALVALARALTTTVLVAVAVSSVVQWRRRGGEPAKWAALSFALLGAVVIAARLVPDTGGELAEFEEKLLIIGIICFPYCLYRFTTAFGQGRRRQEWWATSVTAGMVLATLVLPYLPGDDEPRPGWYAVYIVALLVEWTALCFLSAAELWRHGRGQPTVVRSRMRLLGMGSMGLSLALIAAMADPADGKAIGLVVEGIALGSAALFFIGLVPPRLVLTAWRARDQHKLNRALEGLIAATDDEQVAAALLPELVGVVGGRGAALVDDGAVMAVDGVGLDVAEAAARQLIDGQAEARHQERVHIALRSACLVVWISPYTPIFGNQEIEHLRFLGGLLDVALQRVRLSELERQARRALEREKGFSEGLVRSTSDGMLAFDRELRYTLWNPAMEQLTGVQAMDVLGEIATERFPGLRESGTEEMFRRALAGEHVTSFERFFAIPETGASGWLDLSCSPIKDDFGKVIGGLAVVRDVTFRKQAEELQSHLAAIVDSTDDAILSKDLDGKVLSWNKAATNLYGYTAEEMLGMPASILVPPEHGDEEDRLLARVRSGQRVQRLRTKRVTKAGDVFPVSITISPIRNARGEIVAASSTARDITAVIKAEEALLAAKEEAERANREKSDFLSRMSHELRTPLNAILGFAQLLGLRDLSREDAESVEHISRAGRHLLQLINEVLDISRIETGKLAISLEPVAVEEVIQEALMLVQPLAAEKALHVQRKGDRAPDVHVHADMQRFKQVALNLLSNAIKYNHEGGTVTVLCEQPDGRVRLTISDTGPGIPPDMMDRLYEPFDRLGAEQSGVEGTGLGLALSKGLVEAMGGTLGGRSEVGRGSSFWVELDSAQGARHEDDAEKVVGPSAARSEGPAVWRTVLHVEDNAMNLRLVERVLQARPGIRLLSAMQGSIGVELARQHQPDLVLLDLNLPDIPGTEVLRRLRADPATRDLPVAVVTADASDSQREKLLDAGAYAYVTKPIDVTRFLEVVDEGLGGLPADDVHASVPPARVMLVDDDDSTRRLMRMSLELEGIEVVAEARDGSRAVTSAQELRPDVVLMDLRLPVIDGLEATRQILDSTPGTQVVILTGDDDPAIHERARKAGTYKCLVKGSPPDAVVTVITEAWRQKLADNSVAR